METEHRRYRHRRAAGSRKVLVWISNTSAGRITLSSQPSQRKASGTSLIRSDQPIASAFNTLSLATLVALLAAAHPGLAQEADSDPQLETVPLAARQSASATAASPPPTPIEPAPQDLIALSERARRTSDDLSAARHRIAAAEARLSEAQISPFFQFTLEGGVTLLPDATGTREYTFVSPNPLDRSFGPALQGRLRGAVPIWTFGKLSAARDAASAGVDAAKAELTEVRQRLIRDVRRAYFGLQLALDAQQMIDEGKPKLLKARERFEERLESGDGDVEPVDGYRLAGAVVEIEARESEVTRLQNSARYALQTLTGQPAVRVPDCPLAPVQLALKPMDAYVEDAVAQRPELQRLRAARTAKNAEVQAKQAAFFPDIAVAFEGEANYIPGQTKYEYYLPFYAGAGVVARWNLDLWGHHTRAERSEQEAKSLGDQSSLAEKGIRLEVKTQYEALLDAQRRVHTWETGHRSARRWFVSAAQGYEVGTVSPKELIDGVSAYFKARFEHLQAIHDHNVAIAALEAAVGKPLLPPQQWEAECAALLSESE